VSDDKHPQAPDHADGVDHHADGVDHDLIAQAEDPYRDRYSDADLYKQIHKSQRRIPWWLTVMIGIVILLAIALNAPFLSEGGGGLMSWLTGKAQPQAAGSESFFDFGMLAALFYVGGGFVVIYWFTCWRKGA